MFEPPPSPFLVPADGSFELAGRETAPPAGSPGRKECKRELREAVDALREVQRKLYAQDRWAVLAVFQAMDAAGKDSTIRAVTRGVNPAGFQVYSFRKPSDEELDHDFLWRTAVRLPERGRIGIFNRSYYEEVLVVRVHPGILGGQKLPAGLVGDDVWEHRLQSIADHELHLARNGVAVLKFFLHVSRDEQKRRFLARIDESGKNWKFSSRDVEERQHWDAYMAAYQDALRATSRPWAPWYCVPADDKPFLRLTVARLLLGGLRSLDLAYPVLPDDERERLAAARQRLEAEG